MTLQTVIQMVIAFLLGSFPSGVVLTRRVAGLDVRAAGSGNVGAANVARAAGLKLGALVALLDIVKGVIPVAIGLVLGIGSTGLALVAVCAVIGHDFSPFLELKGGKGVATTLGVALVLGPHAALISVLIWAGTLAASRYSSLASLLALAALPVAMAATGRPPSFVVACIALFVLAAGKHWENILRLITGQEHKLQRRPTNGA